MSGIFDSGIFDYGIFDTPPQTIASTGIAAATSAATAGNALKHSVGTAAATSAATAVGRGVIPSVGTAAATSDASAAGGTGPADPPPSSARPLAVFLNIGQSNELGAAPIPDQSVYPNRARVKMYSLAGVLSDAHDPVNSPAGTLYPIFDDTALCGPQMGFGDEMAPLLKNFDVCLVPCAKGATSIEQWVPGSTLYGIAIERVQAALAASPAGSFIAGAVFYQGESNTLTKASMLGWHPQFMAMVAQLRVGLDLPDLPVVVTAIGPGPSSASFPFWDALQAVQEFMVLPPFCARVITRDLNAPGIDIESTAAAIEIGRRQARAMRDLLPWML